LVLAAAHRFEQLSDKLIGLPLATELVIGIVYLVVLAALLVSESAGPRVVI